jgi:hypothetical protein
MYRQLKIKLKSTEYTQHKDWQHTISDTCEARTSKNSLEFCRFQKRHFQIIYFRCLYQNPSYSCHGIVVFCVQYIYYIFKRNGPQTRCNFYIVYNCWIYIRGQRPCIYVSVFVFKDKYYTKLTLIFQSIELFLSCYVIFNFSYCSYSYYLYL